MRVFLALTPNTQSQKALKHLQSSLTLKKSDQYYSLEKLHVTLLFCGEISEENVTNMVTIMLEGPSHTTLTLHASGFSFFGHEHTKRLVLCFKKTEELSSLYDHCVAQLLEHHIHCSIHEEYKPHVTLAKITSDIALPQLHNALQLTFSHVVMFESTLTPTGSIYHQLAALELR